MEKFDIKVNRAIVNWQEYECISGEDVTSRYTTKFQAERTNTGTAAPLAIQKRSPRKVHICTDSRAAPTALQSTRME